MIIFILGLGANQFNVLMTLDINENQAQSSKLSRHHFITLFENFNQAFFSLRNKVKQFSIV